MCNQNSLLYILAFLALLTAYLSTKFPMSTSPHSMPPHAIIIGSGLAGLSAASQLLTHGIPVLLLERSTKPGGNSIKASSGINAAPTTYQPVTEPLDAFSTDTRRSAGRAMQSLTAQREKLVETLTCGSAGAVAWLVNEKGGCEPGGAAGWAFFCADASGKWTRSARVCDRECTVERCQGE
jgi:FAD-dependent fumarate reductase